MTRDTISIICESRLLVGLLGEKHQAGWWDCLFLSPSSPAFLTPVYSNSVLWAQYTGVCQAAMRIHDEHIGIGRHYHMYRLPDPIEQNFSKYLQNNDFSSHISTYLETRESALARLTDLGAQKADRAEGPIVVGDYSDSRLSNLIKKSLSYYLTAFESGYKTFPYMRVHNGR